MADFGISRKLEEGKTTVYTDRAGTQGWEATEIVNQTEKGRYKMSSDIQVCEISWMNCSHDYNEIILIKEYLLLFINFPTLIMSSS